MEPAVLINLMGEFGELEDQREHVRARLQRCLRLQELGAEVRREEEQDARDAAERGKRAAAGFHNAETRVQAAEAELARSRRRLQDAGDLRQAAALRKEVAALEARLDDLLEQACALLAAVDAAGTAAPAAGPPQGAGGPAAGETARLRESAAGIEEQLARLLDMMPADAARHVRRLWGQGRRAVVFVADGGACGGCRGLLPPQQGLAAQRGQALIRCPCCASYIVARPWGGGRT